MNVSVGINMKHSEYLIKHSELCKRMEELTLVKQLDYSSGSDDAFFNVSRCESKGVVTTEQGIYIRISDKIARIESFLKKGSLEVKDESLIDSCVDLANYSLMLGIYLINKEKK